jgi:hypothetical protein
MFVDPKLCRQIVQFCGNKLSVQILDSYSVEADSRFTFYCRRYLLVQIPDSHSVAEDTMPELRIRGFPLAFDREPWLHKKPKQQVKEMSIFLMIEF